MSGSQETSHIHGSLLIPGMASIGSVVFQPLLTELEKLNVHSFRPIDLPSVDPKTAPESNGLEADIAAIRAQLIKDVEEKGLDIVILAHSYGATPVLGASTGLWKITRSKAGKKGGIIKAAIIGGGISLSGESRGGSIAEFVQSGGEMNLPQADIEQTPMGLLVKATDCAPIFFNDLSPTESEKWDSTLRPSVLSILTSPLPETDPKEWNIAYLQPLQDRGVPIKYGEWQIKRARDAGATVSYDTIDTGHFSWLGKGKETAEWIKGVVDGAGA